MTHLCKGGCAFCPAPYKNEDRIVSAFGENLQINLNYAQKYHFDGVSFSGGDCFLVFDRLLRWLTLFKKEKPDSYYWAYTNGLAADGEKMARLAEAGLDELRFNIAATGYDHPDILQNIQQAARLFKTVTVEIPSIPRDFEKLAGVLPQLHQYGVKYLNLHQYILVPEDPYTDQAVSDAFLLNHEMQVKYDVHSLANTEKIAQFCRQNGLGMSINNCSLQQKEHQMKLRRLTMGEILKKGHERLTDEGFLEVILRRPENAQLNLKPLEDGKTDGLSEYLLYPDGDRSNKSREVKNIMRLLYLPPLGIDEKRILYRSEITRAI